MINEIKLPPRDRQFEEDSKAILLSLASLEQQLAVVRAHLFDRQNYESLAKFKVEEIDVCKALLEKHERFHEDFFGDSND